MEELPKRMKDVAVAEEKLTDWIAKFWNPVPDVWPRTAQIQMEITESPEYAAVAGLGVPKSGTWKNLSMERILELLTQRVCTTIEERWSDDMFHKLPSIEALIEAHIFATQNFTEQKEGQEAHLYAPVGAFVQTFYKRLESRIGATLYAEKQVYSLEELEGLIPHVDSPNFSRERVMLDYMMEMEKLKPRGEEWRKDMAMLQRILDQ